MPGENPLLHFLKNRDKPGIAPAMPAGETSIPHEVRRNTTPNAAFELFRPLPDHLPRLARVLAYYLPQFHTVAENEAWWGEGFTEWTNVGRALPRFAGHYQPRIPRDLGHYRLDDPQTLRRQTQMARQAGLHGFVFYFYWFNGHRLLEFYQHLQCIMFNSNRAPSAMTFFIASLGLQGWLKQSEATA